MHGTHGAHRARSQLTYELSLASSQESGSISDVRSHRMPACVLALALAVGLGALLVGLSVAPKVLPGDTFRVEPRSLSSVDDDPTNIHAPSFHAAHAGATSHVVPLAALSMASFAPSIGSGLGRLVAIAARLTALPFAPAGCRGPPTG